MLDQCSDNVGRGMWLSPACGNVLVSLQVTLIPSLCINGE